MLSWTPGSVTIIWPHPLVQLVTGFGMVGLGVTNIVDILVTGVTFPASVLFSLLFASVIAYGIRALCVSVSVGRNKVRLIGAVRIVTLARADVIAVEVTTGFDGHSRTRLHLSSGTKVELPMAINGSESSVRKVAGKLAEALDVDLVTHAV